MEIELAREWNNSNCRTMVYWFDDRRRYVIRDNVNNDNVPWCKHVENYKPTVFSIPPETSPITPPLNPVGRTGMIGRGALKLWGGNQYVMVVLAVSGNKFICKSNGYLPGLFTYKRSNKSIMDIVYNECFIDMSMVVPSAIRQVFKGYLDDSRNTDNAWVVANVHLVDCRKIRNIKNILKHDALVAQFSNPPISMPNTHLDIVKLVWNKFFDNSTR